MQVGSVSNPFENAEKVHSITNIEDNSFEQIPQVSDGPLSRSGPTRPQSSCTIVETANLKRKLTELNHDSIID